jgi:hypothetical protein
MTNVNNDVTQVVMSQSLVTKNAVIIKAVGNTKLNVTKVSRKNRVMCYPTKTFVLNTPSWKNYKGQRKGYMRSSRVPKP